MDDKISRKLRCIALVWKRDTYRYTGGKLRFEMHHTKAQCSRAACDGRLCRQHSKMPNKAVIDPPWHKFTAA